MWSLWPQVDFRLLHNQRSLLNDSASLLDQWIKKSLTNSTDSDSAVLLKKGEEPKIVEKKLPKSNLTPNNRNSKSDVSSTHSLIKLNY